MIVDNKIVEVTMKITVMIAFFSLLLVSCAADQPKQSIVGNALKALNVDEKNAMASCHSAGGVFDINSDGAALPQSLSIICKGFSKSLDDFNNNANSYLNHLGIVLNNSQNGFKEKPVIKKYESDKYVSWSISKPLAQ